MEIGRQNFEAHCQYLQESKSVKETVHLGAVVTPSKGTRGLCAEKPKQGIGHKCRSEKRASKQLFQQSIASFTATPNKMLHAETKGNTESKGINSALKDTTDVRRNRKLVKTEHDVQHNEKPVKTEEHFEDSCFRLSDTDILCGNDATSHAIMTHPGTRRFTFICDQYVKAFSEAKEKTLFASKVYDREFVQCRFVCKATSFETNSDGSDDNNLYQSLPTERCIKRVLNRLQKTAAKQKEVESNLRTPTNPDGRLKSLPQQASNTQTNRKRQNGSFESAEAQRAKKRSKKNDGVCPHHPTNEYRNKSPSSESTGGPFPVEAICIDFTCDSSDDDFAASPLCAASFGASSEAKRKTSAARAKPLVQKKRTSSPSKATEMSAAVASVEMTECTPVKASTNPSSSTITRNKDEDDDYDDEDGKPFATQQQAGETTAAVDRKKTRKKLDSTMKKKRKAKKRRRQQKQVQKFMLMMMNVMQPMIDSSSANSTSSSSADDDDSLNGTSCFSD